MKKSDKFPGLWAKCIDTEEPDWATINPTDLVEGEMYEVEDLEMDRNYTTIWLTKDVEAGNERGKNGYNSVIFDFYLDGKLHDIYNDRAFNPWM